MRLRWLLTGAGAIVVAVAVAVALAYAARPHGAAMGPDAMGRAAMGRAAAAQQAMTNPAVDPGTPLLGRPAPGFTLTDQFGGQVSLHQFRGKAVVMAFVDSRCTTVCPLTTESMTEAVSLLGPAAAAHIQLLGIDANPDATAVADVRDYSAAHSMLRSWDFLTGSVRQLSAVWRAYHVYVAASHGQIDHQPAIYLIGPGGGERELFLTQMSYTGVGQQAQLLAGELSDLVPGHPAVRRLVSLRYVPGIKPGSPARLPVIGEAAGIGTARSGTASSGTGSSATGNGASQHTITLGPGHPHLIVFFATWLSEVSDLPARLRALGGYQARALRRGWPTVVAIDETPTETSRGAVAGLLAGLGAGKAGYPVAADTAGRLADGYGVQDLPWIELVSRSGKVLFRHDGWLPTATLAAKVAKVAQARVTRAH